MKDHNGTKMKSEKIIISVYKTTIDQNDLIRIQTVFDNVDKISKWNIDLDDCDNILRIESKFNIEHEIIKTLIALNIKCIELK